MTATLDRPDSLEDHDLDAPRRTDRPVPPGAEAMARPWRLAIAFLGVTVGLLSRLLVANGVGELTGTPLVWAAGATSAMVGLALLTVAGERDRFGVAVLALAVCCALSLGAVQWISPNFATGTLEWNDTVQVALATLGAANGLLVAGSIALAFVRRGPTASVVATLTAGALILAANSVFLRQEWAAVIATGLAFAALLVAWDQAPRHEPLFRPGGEAPRISRAALSLAAVAMSGVALQLWISRSRDGIGRPLPAVVAAVAVIVAAFLGLIRLRREIQRRNTALSEWTAWMREFRTGDLRIEFEQYGGDERAIGDLTAELPRPLSFPDLRVEDGSDALGRLDIPLSSGADVERPPERGPESDVASVVPAALDTPWVPAGINDPLLVAATEEPLGAPVPVVVPLRRSTTETERAAVEATDRIVARGPFSSASQASPISTLDGLRRWLARPAPGRRLIVAIEAMALADYDELPRQVSAAATTALVGAVANARPTPAVVAPVDGPYVLAVFDAADHDAMNSINHTVLQLITRPIDTTEGLVGLTGTVAMVRPGPAATLDDVIDAAITGLVRARHVAIAAAAR